MEDPWVRADAYYARKDLWGDAVRGRPIEHRLDPILILQVIYGI